MTLIGYRELMAMSLEDDDPADQEVQFYVVRKPDRKAKGSARNFQKRLRAQRRPLYVKPHDERHLWLMAR